MLPGQFDFENITFKDSRVVGFDLETPENENAAIAVMSMDGGRIRNVTVSNIVSENMKAAFYVLIGNRQVNRDSRSPHYDNYKPYMPGSIENLTLDRITATDTTIPSWIIGFNGIPVGHNTLVRQPVKNVVISDLSITANSVVNANQIPLFVPERQAEYPRAMMFGGMPACGLPAYGLFARRVDGLSVTNLRFSVAGDTDARSAFRYVDVVFDKAEGLSEPLEKLAFEDGIRMFSIDDYIKAGYTVTKLDIAQTRNLDFHRELPASGIIPAWGGSDVNRLVTTPVRRQGERSLKVQTGNNMWNSSYLVIFTGLDNNVPVPASSPLIGKKFVVSAWVYLETPVLDPAAGPSIGVAYIQSPETYTRMYLPVNASLNQWTQLVTPIYTIEEGHDRFNITVMGGNIPGTVAYFTNIEVYELTQ
jgi:hypothetical protein